MGWINPNFQAMRMHTNNTMDTPTRMASARTMRLDLSGVASDDCPPRNMKNNAAAKLPMMATKAKTTRYDMLEIIR